MISVVITAFNEGEEVQRTIASVRANTEPPLEIILVDDGSTDGSCNLGPRPDLTVIRHPRRTGVACSRNDGCTAARGDAFAFLDAHQRVSGRCLNECADRALAHDAVVWPDVRGFEDQGWTGHGASLCLSKRYGFFDGRWNSSRHRDPVSRISGLIVPGYVMPRAVYERISWIGALKGWGASEPAITVKAFFLDVDVLHLCGPLTRHLFRKKIPYSTPWRSVWRNHALVARVCFDARTWFEHWLPQVFNSHLDESARELLDSPAVLREHEQFQAMKLRSDREFWRGLLLEEEPQCLK